MVKFRNEGRKPRLKKIQSKIHEKSFKKNMLNFWDKLKQKKKNFQDNLGMLMGQYQPNPKMNPYTEPVGISHGRQVPGKKILIEWVMKSYSNERKIQN